MIKKLGTIYGVKSLGLELKDFDEGSRKVKAYLSSFNVKDSDEDVIRPGSFLKSINERGPSSSSARKIAHLRHHDWRMAVGNILELREDDFGLMFVSKMGTSTIANDAFLDYQEGLIKEHSIGFEYVGGKINKVEGDPTFGDFWEITEVKLWEGSAVTFGANEFTPVVEVAKGETGKDHIQTVNDEMQAVLNALKNGGGTDERLYSLEMRLKVVQQKFNSLINSEPSVKKDTLETEDKPGNNRLIDFYRHLK